MQVTIARQLGLEPTTVGNFFMNARRRSHDKWREDCNGDDLGEGDGSIKYEVYEDGMGGYPDEVYETEGMTSLGDEQGYHGMIPAPVHNPHNQLHTYPSTCA